MFNISPTRVWISCLAASGLACLAIVAANFALAEEGQSQSSRKNKQQQQADDTRGPQLRVARGGPSAEPSANSNKVQADPDNPPTSNKDEFLPTPPQPGDINQRLTRLERQIDRLTQEIEALRAILGTGRTTGLKEARSTDDNRANANERKPVPPPNPAISDRWMSDDNRYRQGNLSGARQRSSQAAAARRADQNELTTGQRPGQPSRDKMPSDSSPSKDRGKSSPKTDEPKTPGELVNPAATDSDSDK